MKILILAAMEKEVSLLKNILVNPKDIDQSSFKIYEGSMGSHHVFISQCGIGKVNSALNTQRLLQIIKPDLVINSGVAGGAGAEIGTVLVADKIAYHDVWCGPGTEYGCADGLTLFLYPDKKILEIADKLDLTKGLICSGDKFISISDEIKEIRSHFPDVRAVDMESAAIAHACLLNDVPFAIIRIVSDTPGEGENISQYKDFWKIAPEKTFEAVSQIIESLK